MWHANGRKDVLVHGTLIGGFDKGDTTARNVVLVLAAQEGWSWRTLRTPSG